MDLSAFEKPSEELFRRTAGNVGYPNGMVPPDVQIERNLEANKLRANEGAPSVEEEARLMRTNQSKTSGPLLSQLTEIRPNQPFDKEPDLSAFNKEPDLSAFRGDNPYSVKKVIDSPFEKLDNSSPAAYVSSRVWAIKGMVHGLVEGTPPALVGAAEKIYNILTLDHSLTDDEKAKAINNVPYADKVKHFLESTVGSGIDDETRKIPSFQAGEELGAMTAAVPLEGIKAGTYAATGSKAAAEAVGAVGETAMGAIMLKGAFGKKAKPTVEPTPPKPVKPPLTEADMGIEHPPRQMEMFDDSPNWKIDEYGMPYKEQITQAVTDDLFSPEAAAANERVAQQTSKDTNTQRHATLWEEFSKEREATAQARETPLSETYEPSQSSVSRAKITKPINNRSSRYQGGVIDPDLLGINKIGMAIRNAVLNFPKDVAESKFLEKFKGTFNTTDDLVNKKDRVVLMNPDEFLKSAADRNSFNSGDPSLRRTRQMSIEDALNTADGLRDHPVLEISGEPGNWEVSGHNGRHRMDVFKNKGLEKVPVEIRMADDWYTPEDFLKSQDTHITSENGVKIPKPEALSKIFDKERAPKIGEQVRLANGNSGRVTTVTDSAVQVKTDTGIESTHPSGIMYKMNPLGNKQGGAIDLSWMFRNRKTKMSKDLQHRQGTDLRDYETLIKDLGIEKPLTQADDLGQLSTFFNVAPTIGQLNWNKATGRILKNRINVAQEIDNMATKHYKAMIQSLEPISKLARESRKKITQAAIDFDGMNNGLLTQAGLMWPDDTMLQNKGLSPAEIHAYKEQTKGIDYAYDLLDEAYKRQGLEAPERIPGYFPHFWTGSYRVMISDPHGGPMKQSAYSTKLGALHGAKVAESLGLNAEIIDPSSHVDSRAMVSTIIDSLQVWKNQKGLNKPLLDKLLRFDELSKRGIIKEALEREGVTGHEAEQGFNNNYMHNNRLLDAYRSLMESSSQFWANARIAHEVYGPVIRDGKLFENTPNFNKTLENFVGRATGMPSNHLAVVDTALRGASKALGLPPTAIADVGRGLGSFMTYAKLVVPNPGFYASQIIQPLLSMADVWRVHEERGNTGAKQGNPVTAWGTMLKEFVAFEQGGGSAETRAAIKWAEDNNKIDVYSADHVNPLANNNPVYHANKSLMEKIPRTIEERGRRASFLMNYNYFKGLMPLEEAYRAAAHEADINMANYQRMNSASMYTDYGLLGQMARPFGLIRNAYLGKAAMYVMTATEGVLKGRPQAAAPLAAMLGTYLAVAGLTGTFGFVEWDAFARMYNGLVNPDVPMKRPGEFLREHGVNNDMIYGALGNAVNLNIGPSLAAPAMTELSGIPAIDAGASFLKLMVEGYKEVDGQGANMTNIYKSVKAIAPPISVPFIEDAIGEKTGSNPQASNFHGGVNRTPQEDMMFKLTGKRTISETDRRDVDSLVKVNDVNNKGWKATQISKIVDAIQGIGNGDVGKLITQAQEAGRGFDAKSLIEAIRAEQKARALEQKTRELSDIAKSQNPADQGRRLDYRQRMER